MTVRKGLLNTWISVTKTARKEKAIHIFIQWVALLVRWDSDCTSVVLDQESSSFRGERTIEGQQHGGSLLLYVRKNRRNAAKALENVLQQDSGVHVSDQTVRNRLHEGQKSSGTTCAYMPSSEAQLVLQEHETGRSPAGIPSSEQMWWACCWVRHKMWKGMIALNCASFKKKINGIPTGKCIQLSSIGVKMRCVKWPQVRKVIWLKILVCTTML